MLSDDIEFQLLGNVLDGLDDLFDRRERAVWWLRRLLVASGVAFRGTPWEHILAETAGALAQILMGQAGDDEKIDQALAATDDLRLQFSDRWAELHP